MPIVFVHGVNNRTEDADYASGVSSKKAYFSKLLAPELGLEPSKASIEFPYWGGHAAKFKWNQASFPGSGLTYLGFGLGDGPNEVTEADLWLQELRHQAGATQVNFGDLSKDKYEKGTSFSEAVDAVWDIASALRPPEEAEEISDYYIASLAYAEKHPNPAWALQTPSLTNADFVSKLIEESKKLLEPEPDEAELVHLGLRDWFPSLREAASRLANAPSDAVSTAITALGRKSIHSKASRFLGDIFVYLATRDGDGPDSILHDVITKIRVADKARKAGDDKLIIVGHSLGGLLAYDVMTHYAPEVQVDHFVTVGSQVAVFEELTLCRNSDPAVPNANQKKVKRLSNVGKWTNVFDTNDVFSFVTSGVYEGTQDFAFDTGYGLLEAHGGYFARPSFYKRLAARMKS